MKAATTSSTSEVKLPNLPPLPPPMPIKVQVAAAPVIEVKKIKK